VSTLVLIGFSLSRVLIPNPSPVSLDGFGLVTSFVIAGSSTFFSSLSLFLIAYLVASFGISSRPFFSMKSWTNSSTKLIFFKNSFMNIIQLFFYIGLYFIS